MVDDEGGADRDKRADDGHEVEVAPAVLRSRPELLVQPLDLDERSREVLQGFDESSAARRAHPHHRSGQGETRRIELAGHFRERLVHTHDLDASLEPADLHISRRRRTLGDALERHLESGTRGHLVGDLLESERQREFEFARPLGRRP